MRNVIIIGGIAAGCKAAARLSRISPDFKIIIIERGSFISFGNCGLPLFASGDVDDLFELSKTSYGVIRDKAFFKNVKGVEVFINTEAEDIDTKKSVVTCKDLQSNNTFDLPYDSLILATGANAVQPKFPFEKSPRISSFHSPLDAKAFRNEAQRGKINKAVIIGGGFIGCELVEALTSLWGIETVLIEKEDSLLGRFVDPEMSGIIENRIKENGVKVLLSTEVEKIGLDKNELPVVSLKGGEEISSDYVLYNLGVQPETWLAKQAGVELGMYGGIIVDEQMRTNIPGIWAAGDCVLTENIVTGKPDYFPMGSLSNRMGRTAADSIAGINNSFSGSAGTASLKLYDLIICTTGLTERKANEYGLNLGSVIGCWKDRPDYHPESKNIFGKLIYEKDTLKLLGLQLVGEGEVTRYIDVFSELLSGKRTIYDLINLEHAYTPPHSSPVSPLNHLGYMAISLEKESIQNFNPACLSSYKSIFIDVRETSEIGNYPFLDDSIKIPLTELRAKLQDTNLPESVRDLHQPIMFVCEKGPRSYEAARLFINNGYKNVSYLGGGNLLLIKAGLLGSLQQVHQEATGEGGGQ